MVTALSSACPRYGRNTPTAAEVPARRIMDRRVNQVIVHLPFAPALHASKPLINACFNCRQLASVRSGMVTESDDAAARCADERGKASGDTYMHAPGRIGARERDNGHVLEPVRLRCDRKFLRHRIEDSRPHCGKQRRMCRQVVGTRARGR